MSIFTLICQIMELYGKYVETVLLKCALLWNSLCALNMGANIIICILVLNIITLIYLLGNMFSGKDSKTATPAFWLVACFFSFGFCTPLFWALEIIIRRKASYCNINFICIILLPALCSMGGYLLLEEMSVNISELNLDIIFIAGLIIAGILLLIQRNRCFVKEICVEDDLDSDLLKTAAVNRKQRKELCKASAIQIGESDNAICIHKVNNKILKEYFLVKEVEHDILIEKKYVTYRKELNVLELPSVFYRAVCAGMASLMVLLMLFPPYLIWLLERVIDIIT